MLLYDLKYRAARQRLLDDYTADMKAEWTADLLASTFGTPNGRVTWAEATTDDHRAHIDMNLQAVDGYMNDSALHRRAIATIEAAGATTLGEALVSA